MSTKEISRAKEVCATCPVRRDCLQDGLSEEWGIWGGFTRAERERGQKILGTWIEDEQGLTIIPAEDDAVMVAYDSGLLRDLVVLS